MPKSDHHNAEAQKLVDSRLAALNARDPIITEVTDRNVRDAFPGYVVYSVRFRMYPIALTAPEPLKSQNLFFVRDHQLREMTDFSKLEPWFKRHISRQRSEAEMRRAVRAWLVLSEEFKQDGFYKFLTLEDTMSLTMRMGETEATGKAVVTGGGTGEICVTLTIEKAGNIIRAAEVSTVKPGVRPICQATKLLDKDPIVRKMAEQDLLVMGRAAKPYLDEQSKKASPALRQAIDRVWKRILSEHR